MEQAKSKEAKVPFAASYALVFALIALIGLFSVWIPDQFLTVDNFRAMLETQSAALILALAVIIPLRAGDFDLSVAAVMVFAMALVAILTTKSGLPTGLAIPLALLFGVAVGLVNSIFIVKLGINAFIVTLGMMTLIQGFTFGITDGSIISKIPASLLDLSRTQILGIPLAVYYGWILALGLWYVFEHTPIGRRLLFVGGNPEATRLAGISIDRVRIGAFVASSVLSAAAGIILLGRLGSADPTLGPGYLLPPYAAAFLGAAAVQLGRFNVWGTVIAVYLLVVATTGLLLLGTQSWVTDVFNGAALIAAVTFARLVEIRNARKAA